MKKISFNFGWTRNEGNSFGSLHRRSTENAVLVDLPDDFIIQKKRDKDSSGGANSGFYPGGVATYSKTLSPQPEWEGKTVLLDIDGAYMNAEVFLNNERVGYHPYGYTAFFADLTPALDHENNNVLEVVTQCRQPDSRWYSGCGIYRDVNLWIGGNYYIHPWDTYVTTEEATPELATLSVQVDVTNKTNDSTSAVLMIALKADGKAVAARDVELWLNKNGKTSAKTALTVPCPRLWDVETPHLYTIEYSLCVGNTVQDSYSEKIGIRKIEIDHINGIRINGRSLKLRGGSIHHDNALIGARALPAAEERKIRILKDAGYNAVRTAHNPPSRALLDACDRLGMLVLEESFDAWTIGKTAGDYHLFFEDWWERDTRSMVLRDRNHPCVFCWSVGNEIIEMMGKKAGAYWTEQQADYVRTLDPSRPVTGCMHCIIDFKKANINLNEDFFVLQGKSALTAGIYNGVDHWAIQTTPSTKALDVVGYNYMYGRYADDIKRFPDRVIIGSETHAATTYDYWKATLECPNVIGDFIWCAMDYLGEVAGGRIIWDDDPSKNTGKANLYPWLSNSQGDFNLDGDRRPQSYYRKIMWGLDDGIHIFVTHPDRHGHTYEGTGWHWGDVRQSWTYDEKYIGTPARVEAYSDCDEVEFRLNGRSLGTVKTDRLTAVMEIPYEPGMLEAVAIRAGRADASTSLKTTGAPAKLLMIPERNYINADGNDLAYVHIQVADANGLPVVTNDIKVSVTVDGAAALLGLGSGNPCTSENYTGERFVFNGRALVCARASTEAGAVTIKACADGLEPGIISLPCQVL